VSAPEALKAARSAGIKIGLNRDDLGVGRRGRQITKKTKRNIAKPYEPTPRECAAVKASFAKQEEKTPAPRVKLEIDDGHLSIRPDHPNPSVGIRLLMEATGTTDPTFLRELLYQLADAATTDGKTNESDVNFMLSVVKGAEPRDQFEAMLAAQMAAVHTQTMSSACRLANVDTIQQQDSAERAFNKLARTFTMQIEAFKRYRTGGQQKVTVEHVTVNAGGQAIVGNVAHGGRGGGKK
jgi:hypothetical protein